MVILVLVGIAAVVALLLIAFTYPEWLVSGGKFLVRRLIVDEKHLVRLVRHNRS